MEWIHAAGAQGGQPLMDTRTRWALGVILTALAIAIVVAAVAGSAQAGSLPLGAV